MGDVELIEIRLRALHCYYSQVDIVSIIFKRFDKRVNSSNVPSHHVNPAV